MWTFFPVSSAISHSNGRKSGDKWKLYVWHWASYQNFFLLPFINSRSWPDRKVCCMRRKWVYISQWVNIKAYIHIYNRVKLIFILRGFCTFATIYVKSVLWVQNNNPIKYIKFSKQHTCAWNRKLQYLIKAFVK